jgi:hypothetical protein
LSSSSSSNENKDNNNDQGNNPTTTQYNTGGNNQSQENKNNNKRKCPEGQHYDKELKMCVVDNNVNMNTQNTDLTNQQQQQQQQCTTLGEHFDYDNKNKCVKDEQKGQKEICDNGKDDDNDGDIDEKDSDCKVQAAGEKEICDNGIDDDGDGLVDGQDLQDCPLGARSARISPSVAHSTGTFIVEVNPSSSVSLISV